jgi:hypothetical protein
VTVSDAWITGLELGLVIGLPTTAILLLLVLQGYKRYRTGQSTSANNASVLGVVGFWFGGPAITGPVLKLVDWNPMLPGYMTGLLVLLVPTCCIPLLIIAGREIWALITKGG